MKQITKKEFKQMHKNKAFKLVYSFSNKNKGEAQNKILEVLKANNNDIINHLKELTRCDIDNQGDMYKVECFTNDNMVFVEITIDNSLNNQCSWNNIQVNTIVYMLI